MESTRIRVYISIELKINLDGKRQGVKNSSIRLENELIKESGSMSVVMDWFRACLARVSVDDGYFCGRRER